MKRPSFLERLTGSKAAAEYEDEFAEESVANPAQYDDETYQDESDWQHGGQPGEPQEGELPVDMYQTSDAVVIRALVAGVSPDDLDIAITRDMVTIKGLREEIQETADDDYYHRELFWGSFTRTLLLPEEVQIDEAEASEKHGLLEIRLPKVDKGRSARLKVRSNSMQK